MGFFDFLFGGDSEEQGRQESTQTTKQAPPQFAQAPEYAEAEGARKNWWTNLQQWGNMPGYGAIGPNWQDIWDKAAAKVNRFYWGGPAEGGGLVGKIRSSAARRNVSQSPALEEQIKEMGLGQGLQLGEMATEQAKTEAAFGEQGRQNWLTSLMNLSQQRPQGSFYTPSTTTTGVSTNFAPSEGFLPQVAPFIGQMIAQRSQQNWLTDLFSKYGSVNRGENSGNSGIGSIDEGAWNQFGLPVSILGGY